MIVQKTKSTTPQLRFPEFTDEWQMKKLGDIAEFSKGSGISKNDIHENGEIEAIRYGELYTTYNEIIDEVKSKTNLSPSRLKLSKANDVIIPASGETSIDIATASCVMRDNIALSGDLNIIRTQNNGIFMAYYLNNKKKNDIARLAQGISVIHLYSSSLKDLEVNLPPKPAQQKIADFLTTVDDKITALDKKIELLKQYKKGVMQQIFSQKVRFKDENGQDYPEWEYKILGEVVDINPKINALPDKFVYIDLESVKSGALIQEKHIEKKLAPSRAQRLLEKNDILFQTVRPYQRNNLFFILEGGYVASTGYAQIRYKPCPMFIYQLMHTELFVNRVLDYCTGTNYPAINSTDLGEVSISIPASVKEQQKIADLLAILDDKITTEQTRLAAAKEWKKGLLQRMFV